MFVLPTVLPVIICQESMTHRNDITFLCVMTFSEKSSKCFRIFVECPESKSNER